MDYKLSRDIAALHEISAEGFFDQIETKKENNLVFV